MVGKNCENDAGVVLTFYIWLQDLIRPLKHKHLLSSSSSWEKVLQSFHDDLKGVAMNAFCTVSGHRLSSQEILPALIRIRNPFNISGLIANVSASWGSRLNWHLRLGGQWSTSKDLPRAHYHSSGLQSIRFWSVHTSSPSSLCWQIRHLENFFMRKRSMIPL